MATCGIYGLYCRPTGKWYVGQSRNIERRWSYYRTQHIKSQPELRKAIEQFGIGNFTFSVLQECEAVDLDSCERYWIKEKRSYYIDPLGGGYNMTIGGQVGGMLGKRHSEEAKKKIGDKHRGKKAPKTQEHIDKVTAKLRGRKFHGQALANMCAGRVRGKDHYLFGKQGPMTGKKHTNEARKKISEGLRNSKFMETCKTQEFRKKCSERMKMIRAEQKMPGFVKWRRFFRYKKPIP